MADKEGSDQGMSENDAYIYKCAQDFFKYCQVEITDETRGLEDSIEEMLANLDEFSHLADTIRNDSSQILFILLPELCAKCQTLPTIFNRIDQLEVFIEKVNKYVDDLEDKIEKAEEDLGSHSIKKVLNAIPYLNLMQKKQAPASKTKLEGAKWQAAEILQTSDFFGQEENEKYFDTKGTTTKLEKSIEIPESD